uniref:NADH dehydrogenase subunit 3 n=1 Tax=Jogocerus viraktamathi TaxID=3111112 RepID=UPI002E7A92A5|nr:NADH dehydrogenase subunit 3 [Jogocerus viraktamathi]WRK19232.1 NADH dehydrogenase subunit 3 [Jogocerus viraktamathi]
MYLTMMHTLIVMLMLIIMMILMVMITKKSMINQQKLTPFECGFNPMSDKRLPFSIHFFLIAVIFLIFDIEIIIILPMMLTMNYAVTLYWLATSLSLIIVLIMGLYHEWYNGMLKWTK